MPKLRFAQKLRNRNFAILEREAENFFPKSGVWFADCLDKSTVKGMIYLPRHLADNDWLSKVFVKNLRRKLILIPSKTVKFFVENSSKFAALKHNYALEIVKWETDCIMHNNGNWLAPEDYDDLVKTATPDFTQIVRDEVVDTLLAINIDRATIEEGLEKNADQWRSACMERSFRNLYEPTKLLPNRLQRLQTVKPEHKKNWFAVQEYLYFQKHADSVKQYGQMTPAMRMSPEAYAKLVTVLEEQNQAREDEIKSWRYAKDYAENLMGNCGLN